MYTFNIKNYRAIKNASICIDGITVLAGINGSGKSTLSRWLYYIVNATHGFEKYQRRDFISSLTREVDKVQRFFMLTFESRNYQTIKTQLRRLRLNEEFDREMIKDLFYAFLKKAEIDLREYAKSGPHRRKLAAYLLEEEPGEIDDEGIINQYLQMCRDVFENGYSKYVKKIESNRRDDLERVIIKDFSDGERLPSDILFVEGETPLLNSDSFIIPLMLTRALYIDSPMAVSGQFQFQGKNIWEDFHHYLYEKNPSIEQSDRENLNFIIHSIIGGDIKLTDDEFNLEKELHYVSKEQGFDININDAATGVKTFAYISQLLKNGWLDKNTLLLIDEPEAHLHPQWIVEFARLLVMIRKELGVKIVLASHNPDMVAAIQSIAKKEGVIDETVFYLAEKNIDDYRYDFIDKGKEIGDIFTSFNIALSRIEMYGTPMI